MGKPSNMRYSLDDLRGTGREFFELSLQRANWYDIRNSIGFGFSHYSDNEEIELPVPKRVPIIWSDEDDRDLPLHSDFTKNIKSCAEQNSRESSVALGISSLDFETIINSWDVYVRENPEHGLKAVAEYSARRTERIPVSENEAILQMKKRALVNAFRRPEDRVADDAQMPEEPNDLESPHMTSDDEPPMQHQEDIAQNQYQSESEDSEYQPSHKADGPYNRSRKHQGNRGKENSEYPPHSATHHQSSEHSTQQQSDTGGSDHQPSPATLNKASDDLSNPLVLAEVIAISSDDEHPIQKRSNEAGRGRGKQLPGATTTRSSEHSAQVEPKKEFETEPINNNESGPYVGSRRRTEDYGLEEEEVATYPMTRTRASDSPIRSQGRPPHRTKLSSYSMQRRTGWEDSDIEDEDSQPEITMRDSAQSRSEGNSAQETRTSSAQYRRRERSSDYEPGLTTRTKAPEHSNNRREKRYSEFNDWNSLYDEDLGDNEESERYVPEKNFRVQSFGFKDPALVGGNDEVRRRRRERVESTITRNTSESRDEDNNQRSEKDVRISWHKYTPHMPVAGERIHGALGSEVKAPDKALLQEADIQSDNGMRILSSSEEKEIVPWKRLSDRK
ncbi:hypothetical protein EAF00_003220 [Botryotinia globosa]|nr:hypothetical protein EAF00_003220 [Botryotinia globosa]